MSDETVFCHSSSSFTGGVCCSLPNKGHFQKPKELIEGVKKKTEGWFCLHACHVKMSKCFHHQSWQQLNICQMLKLATS
jgi:hypothetical protein